MPARLPRAAAVAAILTLMTVPLVSAGPQSAWADGGPPPRVDRPRTADFNGDGFGDSAITEWSGDDKDRGALYVLYGSPTGLTTERLQRLTNIDFSRAGGRQPPVGMTNALATGDFDGDGFSDLAHGDPGARAGSIAEAGAVRVIYGSPRGLDARRTQRWTQASPGVVGRAEVYDSFGWALAAGDFGRGPQDDLAVNVWSEGSAIQESGAVNVLYGSADGLTGAGSQIWFGDSPGVPGSRESFEQFGTALAAGRFSGGSYEDLAIGIPSRMLSTAEVAGAVLVLRGSESGLTAYGSRLWSQNTPGVPGRSEENDAFGSALAVGRFAGRPYDDLAISAPNETVAGLENAGAVTILYGSLTGLTAAGSQLWHEGSPGIAGRVEMENEFGGAIAAGSFGRDVGRRMHDDLVIGVPEESHGGIYRVGFVHVLYGSDRGLTSAGAQYFRQGIAGLPDSPKMNEMLGARLTAADFGRSSDHDELVVAGQAESETVPKGAVQVLYGDKDGVSTTSNQFWTADLLGGTNKGERRFGQGVAARS